MNPLSTYSILFLKIPAESGTMATWIHLEQQQAFTRLAVVVCRSIPFQAAGISHYHLCLLFWPSKKMTRTQATRPSVHHSDSVAFLQTYHPGIRA